MLMNVVFPAPLVPIRPTTESFSMAAVTPSAAVTAPKLLFRPRASRMAAISGGFAPEQRPQPVRQEHDREQQRRAHAHLPDVRRQIVGDGAERARHERAEKRRDYASRSREDRDEDEFARGRPVGHF